jgi:hypothetical protein
LSDLCRDLSGSFSNQNSRQRSLASNSSNNVYRKQPFSGLHKKNSPFQGYTNISKRVSDQYFVVTSIVAKFDDFQKYDSFFVLQVCHLRQTFKPTAETCIFVHIILQETEECKM